MNKNDFLKLKLPFKDNSTGNIKLKSINRLPEGVTIAENINEFIGNDSKAEPNIVYFTKNIKGEYYIEITTKETNLKELKEYINLKLVFI